ncbi:hypothetical protein BF17_03445 [Yersinia similis]|uniref:Toxin SymE-like domain-containing protein n=1 Tax=Yersinia similis TaxID=367190 RepID=A0ABM5PUL2_9GAMM|nr:SymE family type I addiction module toxin [Yersinia similis]AHK18500.1 hypothetical protein BF17_03445 [Yersinia similis]CFQ73413.1 HSP20-like protein [Yersinia similis]CNF74305.1 HSP20-like protein [Yersinia similis]
MSLSISSYHDNTIPELFISRENLKAVGFIPETLFKIKLYRNGLMVSPIPDETNITELMISLEESTDEGIDWVRDNGGLYLAGEWLVLSGLAGQLLDISVISGQIVIKAKLV